MEELSAQVRKYGPVMQRYYVQYLSGFDAVVLNELVQVGSLLMVEIETSPGHFLPKRPLSAGEETGTYIVGYFMEFVRTRMNTI